MQHTKVSYELIQNYISSSRDTEKDSPDPASAIEMQEIADAEGVSKSTVSRTIGLARKRISCGMKPAMLKSALKGR